MKMRKPDIMAVLTIAVLAGVMLTMFFQGGDMTTAHADMATVQMYQGGWGQVRSN